MCLFSGVIFHLAGDEIDECFAFNCNLVVCLFLCLFICVAVGWSLVLDCDISWLYSLLETINPF